MSAIPPLWRRFLALRGLVTALVFGLLGLLTLWAKMRVPLIPSQDISADVREVFVIIGAALTGPVGGAFAELVSASYPIFPDPIMQMSANLAHVLAGAALGLAYRNRQNLWHYVLFWWGSVALYYFILVGVFLGMGYFLFPQVAREVAGADALWFGYWRIASSAIPEFFFTSTVTTIALLALPRKYRRPLWESGQGG